MRTIRTVGEGDVGACLVEKFFPFNSQIGYDHPIPIGCVTWSPLSTEQAWT